LAQANKISGERPPECDLVDSEGRLYIQSGEELALPFKLMYSDFRAPSAIAAAVGEAQIPSGVCGSLPLEATVTFTRKGSTSCWQHLHVFFSSLNQHVYQGTASLSMSCAL
jgi:hypothetical protein